MASAQLPGPTLTAADPHLKARWARRRRRATQQENILRSEGISARAARATHCPSGHPYAGDNLYINPKGHRLCRECNRQRSRANYYRMKAA